MNNIFLEIFAIFLLILLNGILAMSEIAIVSSRKIKLRKMAQKENKGAKIVIDLLKSPNEFLSAVQIGITLIGILAGAFGGATIAVYLNSYLSNVSLLAPYSESLSIAIIVLIITYFSLVVGELVPKRIGLNNPENISVKIARPMQLLSKITKPIVSILSFSTDSLLRVLGLNQEKEGKVTEEEIKLLIEEGIESGTVEKEEEDIIKRVFRLDQQKVGTLMTPKTEIIWLDLDDPSDKIRNQIIESKRAIFPVGKNGLNNFLGVVQSKEILESILEEDKFNIEKNLKNPLVIPETLPILDVLNLFKKNINPVHMIMVVDEYGSIEGLITLNDILEALVGDIPAFDEPNEPKAILRESGSWLVDGYLSAEEFKEILNIEKLEGEEEGNFNTISGFIMNYTGKVPIEGEKFQ
ncbi:hemolysin family protein [Methanobacterium alcaliphilum]|uniref:hemolysin family protein n=1 Tax=Methanobacterium alcaliphilum TaxID=392018 RepID=UPI00200B98D6|nr:hemolysin family protein [Methanobacterium alcaliphilum]MCK9150693.1 hemolysin family protein [Methanobacterium alcaliphilum]